ncbi:hypothetical protein SUSP_001161 [Sulfurospirillum sp. 'SP']|nr:hypothetical protein [Sulfurospirillum sp. 'SP']WNY98743.1 hypothetical protein SUSP_001161 [Sulfurospirillum sp. 'SP']
MSWGSASVLQGYTSSTPINNSGWAGSGGPNGSNSVGATVPANNPNFTRPTIESLKQQELSKITDKSLSDAFSPSTKLKSSAYAVKNMSALVNFFKSLSVGDVVTVDDSIKELAENGTLTLEQSDLLNDYLSRQQNSITPPATGETLPSVLTSNAKALVTSVNTLTSTFGEKFDYLNNYMYGLLTYLDIATGLMQQSYSLNKELADNSKKKEEDNTLQVGDSKMSPAEIEARKNLAMLKAYDFKNTPVSQTVLEAENVVGMTPLEIEASHRSFEVEAKVFAKTPQKVKDWDENELADISPREARLVKDATVAIDTTDKINFELDDEDVDNLVTENIRSIFGYADDSVAIKEMFTRLGGIGLPTT